MVAVPCFCRAGQRPLAKVRPLPLLRFGCVIRTVESEQMMFIRMLEPTSYLFSVALTLLFTVVVCRMMRRQVRGISMVESMKAPE